MDAKPSASMDWDAIQKEIFSALNSQPRQSFSTPASQHTDPFSVPASQPSHSAAQPCHHGQRARSLSLSLPWSRPKTSPSVKGEPVFYENAIDDDNNNNNNNNYYYYNDAALSPEHRHHGPAGAIKGMLRRASHSFRGIVHRRPELLNEQVILENVSFQSQPPTTTANSAWSKLRQATSFRYSRSIHPLHATASYSAGVPATSAPAQAQAQAQVDAPIPALAGGNEPPYIPEFSGAAAKAAAALQNEFARLSSQNQWLYHQTSNGDDNKDRESGIGIVVSGGDGGGGGGNSSDFEVDVEAEMASKATHANRLDFITKLPRELAIMILAKLDAAALARISTVSRDWAKVIQDQHIWRQSFLREMSQTFATSRPVEANTGRGIPKMVPENDWRRAYQIKQQLNQRWKEGKALPVYLTGHTDSVYCIQFDESKIISGSRDKTIRIWDLHTFECRLIIGPPEVVRCQDILVDTDGTETHYAARFDDENFIVSRPKVVSFELHHKASILCLQYDDEMLVTGSSDGTAIVYSIKHGFRPVGRLEQHSAAVLDVVFDDKHIVTCSKDTTICVWERKTGSWSLIRQLSGHGGPVNAVQMRGNTIVSCSGDFLVKLWNVETGKNIREFTGHSKGLACSQFSEDGRYVASAGNDKVIRIWDAHTGECVHEMRAHENLVRSLHIDSVSGRLVSASYDTDIKVWDMRTGRQVLDFPRWHASWVLSAKSDYRRIVSTGQAAKILVMDFGGGIEGVEMLESDLGSCDEFLGGMGFEGGFGRSGFF